MAQTIISIDQSGKGTTGICIIRKYAEKATLPEFTFEEFKSENWQEHLDWIIENSLKVMPNIILYEETTYLHGRPHQGSTSLYKLTGGIVAMSKMLSFCRYDKEKKRYEKECSSPTLGHVAVNQVKAFRDKIQAKTETIEGLTYEIGRGKGWQFKSQRISLHLVDALIIYHLWTKENFPSYENTKREIAELESKKRLGSNQQTRLNQLKGILMNYE